MKKRVDYQFQIGLSLPEFIDLFGTEELCRQHLIKVRYPQGFICSHCRGAKASQFQRGSQVIFQCSSCRHQRSLCSQTIFHRSKIPLRKWFCAFHLITQSKNSVSSLELHRHLKVNYNTAWLIKHKIMEMMARHEDNYQLQGRIEVDDAYLGGSSSDGKRGRGSKSKHPFLAAISTNSDGHPLYAKFTAVKAFDRESVKLWAAKNIASGSTTVSDGLACFSALSDFSTHNIHVTSKISTEEKERIFYWVDTVLSNIKTSISGTFHSLDFPRNGRRYLADLQYRFNRRFDLRKMFLGLIQKAIKSPPIMAKSLPAGLSR